MMDSYLSIAFDHFINIIPTKLYVYHHTGKSKGFGFILYDSIVLSDHTIYQMNGFQIGSKSLKVQHKRVHHNRYLAVLGGGDSGEGGGGGGYRAHPYPCPPSCQEDVNGDRQGQGQRGRSNRCTKRRNGGGVGRSR